ncbi:MAG TPA: MBL fold metallo-hydrolase [Chromatiales bacterium]|nr:MBL fold metallo-hydrolase [Chromatiales bacterium]
MLKQLDITVLVENQPAGRGLLGEHGLAFHLRADGRNVLFDTGQGLTLLHNADLLGLDLSELSAIVLSHGHYDHTGGLPGVLERCGTVDIFLHPEALRPKFNRDGKDVGTSQEATAALGHARKIHATEKPTEIVPGLFVTGPVPRRNAFEDTGGPFYCDAQKHVEDLIPDDQSLYAVLPEGVVVILGCCHAGVVNTLEYISELTGGAPIHALIGGTHLLRAGEERLAHTAGLLETLDVKVLAPNHCTGLNAQCYLRARFPDRFVEAPAGKRFHFGDPS